MPLQDLAALMVARDLCDLRRASVHMLVVGDHLE
jgi:hypothetical protein